MRGRAGAVLSIFTASTGPPPRLVVCGVVGEGVVMAADVGVDEAAAVAVEGVSAPPELQAPVAAATTSPAAAIWRRRRAVTAGGSPRGLMDG